MLSSICRQSPKCYTYEFIQAAGVYFQSGICAAVHFVIENKVLLGGIWQNKPTVTGEFIVEGEFCVA